MKNKLNCSKDNPFYPVCDEEVVKFSATQVSADSWRLSLFPDVHLFNLIKHWSLRIIFLLSIIQTQKYPFLPYLLNIPSLFYVPLFCFSCCFFLDSFIFLTICSYLRSSHLLNHIDGWEWAQAINLELLHISSMWPVV